MSTYKPGDVVLAKVQLGTFRDCKVRPVVVICMDGEHLTVYPVSSTPSTDTPSKKLELYDFISGGLDITGESYILLTCHCRIRPGEVLGLKGRLSPEFLDELKAGTMMKRSSQKQKK